MGIETTTTVTCDGCGEPIEIRPHYPNNFYIELRDADRGRHRDDTFVYGVICHPELGGTKTFHSLRCLDQWRSPKESK